MHKWPKCKAACAQSKELNLRPFSRKVRREKLWSSKARIQTAAIYLKVRVLFVSDKPRALPRVLVIFFLHHLALLRHFLSLLFLGI